MTDGRPTQDDVLACTARVPDHVVYRPFAQETVMLNLETGRYHGLNPTAGFLLSELERGLTVGEATARLAERYERPFDTVARDAYAVCLDLVERGLVELRAAEAGGENGGGSRGTG